MHDNKAMNRIQYASVIIGQNVIHHITLEAITTPFFHHWTNPIDSYQFNLTNYLMWYVFMRVYMHLLSHNGVINKSLKLENGIKSGNKLSNAHANNTNSFILQSEYWKIVTNNSVICRRRFDLISFTRKLWKYFYIFFSRFALLAMSNDIYPHLVSENSTIDEA